MMRYDRQTQDLLKEIATLRDTNDRRILSAVARLKRTATALNDNYLLGFTYYHSAYGKYYFRKNYGNFTEDLVRAAGYLVYTNDHEILARVYNFVAVDSHMHGCYNIAYNYYMNALEENRTAGILALSGTIETNLGLVFFELRDLGRALKHTRSAIRFLKKCRDERSQPLSLLLATLNEAMILIEKDDTESASRSLGKAEVIASAPELASRFRLYRIQLSIVRICLFFRNGNASAAQHVLAELVIYLTEERALSGYIDDINFLCRTLLSEGMTSACQKIIDVISAPLLSSGNAHTLRLLNELKIDCYMAAGDKKRLSESLAEQPYMLDTQHATLGNIFSYTKDLVRIDNDLRNAQLITRAENKKLQKRAYHDALTGIANRYMLMKMLVASFERAKASRTVLGITILDIDDLKPYNDTYGHSAGDHCIITVASELSRLAASAGGASASVFCARYGGDEFVLIYEGMHAQQIARHARDISEAVSNLKLRHKNSSVTGFVSVSQGQCIAVPDQKSRLWDFMLVADKALYSVKHASDEKRRKTLGIACAAPVKTGSGRQDA